MSKTETSKTLAELLAASDAAIEMARKNPTAENRAAAVAASAAYCAAAPQQKLKLSRENTAAARSGRRQHAELIRQTRR
jgi:putative hemolysin